jgi:hypothetical protein
MRTLRLILCWIYAFAAFIFLRASVSTYRDILFLSQFHGPWSNVRSIAGGLIVAAVGVVYGMAWWTILLRKPSARIWAMIASILQILLCVVLCGLDFYRGPGILWQPVLVLIAIGVAGIILFWHRDPPLQPDSQLTRLPAPGDGTNPFLDKFVWIASSATALALIIWWSHWGRSRGLPDEYHPVFYFELFLISLLALAIHEAGHAITGRILEMKLLGFVVGPLQWQSHYGKWKFKFHTRGLLSFIGLTRAAPVTLSNFRERKILQVAAGPIANLLSGLAATGAAFISQGRPWERFWYLLACFATISLVASASSLIPHRIQKAGYSDGAKIYQLLSGGLWADYHRALAITLSSMVSPLRPREYDVDTMRRAAGSIAHGQDQLLMLLCAYSYYFDRGDLTEALEALDRAEAFLEAEGLKIPAEWHGPFIFGNALLRRDAARTRLWWERLESQKPPHFDEEYWTCRSAVLWMENHIKEAREALKKADAWANQLPHVGIYEAERNSIVLLRKALDEPSCAEVAEPLPLSGSTLATLPPDPLPAS